jgi:hypothetical protein
MHFSSALYSGNKVRSVVYLPQRVTESFPDAVKEVIIEPEHYLGANGWALAELHVAMFPEKRIHLQFYKAVCAQYTESKNELVFTLYGRPHFITGERSESSYFCDEL